MDAVQRDDRLLLTIPEAASTLGVSPRRLYALAATPGALPDGLVVHLGRSVRVSRPMLQRWLGAAHDGEEVK